MFALYRVAAFGFSNKHLVFSLASVFEMVSSLAFKVSIWRWLLPSVVPICISLSAASLAMVLYRVPLSIRCELWDTAHCRLVQCRTSIFDLCSYVDHGFLYFAIYTCNQAFLA